MDWAEQYGRSGFSAGLFGAARPFNKPNKPVLNVSLADFTSLNNANLVPSYYDNGQPGEDNVVLWDNNYTNPLPAGQQFANTDAIKRIQKREYIKDRMDDVDPELKINNPADSIRKRKARRQALTQNPLTMANNFIQGLLPPRYTQFQLDNEEVRREPWMNMITQYNTDVREARRQLAARQIQRARRARVARIAANRARAERDRRQREQDQQDYENLIAFGPINEEIVNDPFRDFND